MAKKKWENVGAIFRKLDDNGNDTGIKYIRINNVKVLVDRIQEEDGVNLVYQKPEDRLRKWLELDILSEDEFNAKMESLSPKLAFEIQLPPKKD